MPQHTIAKTHEFEELKPVYSTVNGLSIAVYRFQGRYYAYANRCPHQSGPACEGLVVADARSKVNEAGRLREFISNEDYDIACPWHGFEFDVKTGICRATPIYRLLKIKVSVDGEDVSVAL